LARPGLPLSSPVVTAPQTQHRTDTDLKTDEPVMWNVVLLNDDDHTFDYVISMMQELFTHDLPKAKQIAKNVDSQGRAVCLTTHKEHAELKQEQVHAYGPDKFTAGSKGSMTAIIEPAEFGSEDDEHTPDDHA
jgi:ATP-dependent Clp protease adaptor protein ClpS